MTLRNLPTGTVSFLFTDIEGSTRLVQDLGDDWPRVLAAHSAIVSDAISAHDGLTVKTEGDSFFAVFEEAQDAVDAAIQAQRGLAEAEWPAQVRVRMGIHTGDGVLGGEDYLGLDVHRAARIADSAHGGQIVISETTAIAVDRRLPSGVNLRDMGKYRLKDLYHPEPIFQLVVEGLEQEFPALRTIDVIPNNLPDQLTPFFGRRAEINQAVELLDRARLLTLTGPGGTGKTRLSLQIAVEISQRYPDGVFFVGLSPISEVEVVPSVVLGSLGLSASGDESPADRLLTEIADKRLLMVVDNLEHLLSAASLISSMVKAAPRCQFIVTSRAPLRIQGEQEMAVPPLEIPHGLSVEAALSSESVQLLVDRARAVRPDFEIDEHNAADVVELMRRLDGLPLAIELVTSRLRQFPIRTILDRLDSKMLAAGSVDLPERQRTIESAISWSYDMLDAGAKELFCRMAVFAGGVRLDELETFHAGFDDDMDLFDALGELVEQSLLTRRPDASGERYRMLHVIREFAIARLEEKGDAERSNAAHFDLYTKLAVESAANILGPDRPRLLDRLEAEHDNVRSALEWGMENQRTDGVLRLSAAMWRFWQARGHLYEAATRLAEALALPDQSPKLRAKGLEALGGVYWWRGDMLTTRDYYEEALDIHRNLGDRAEIANAMYNYALARASSDEDLDESDAIFGEALEIYRELGDDDGIANVSWGLGQTHLFKGDYELAEQLMLEGAEAYERAGNEFGLAWSKHELGMVALRQDDLDRAWSYFESALKLFRHSGDVSGFALASYGAAGIAYHMGDQLRAYRMYGAMESMIEATGTKIVQVVVNLIEPLDQETMAALTGEDRQAYLSGRAMSADEALAYALAGPVDDSD